MNKGIWKLMTLLGFVLAVVVLGTVLVFRYRILDRISLFSKSPGGYLSQTQQLTDAFTQILTQQTDLSLQDADQKNLQRLIQSCFTANDCISSIDSPKFVSVRQASKFLDKDDLVVGVAFDDWKRGKYPVKAYPVKILNWHEVVNDSINEIPVAVTYGPLTMTHRVFRTMSEGEARSFGVSGMVLNSTVVLYDRVTKSLWNQFDGVALSGPARGTGLELYPSVLVRWEDWVREYPSTVVLSANTGFDFHYNDHPYPGYADRPETYYPLEHSGDRLKSKEPVYGVVLGNRAKIYPESELIKAFADKKTVDDEFAGKKLILSYAGKEFNVVDALTDEEVPALTGYYFVWEAFHPGVEIYRAPVQELPT